MVWWFGSGFPSQKTGVQIPNPPIQTTNSGQPDTRHPNKAPSPKNDEHTSDPLTHPLLGGTHPNKCTWKLTKEIRAHKQASKQAPHTYSSAPFISVQSVGPTAHAAQFETYPALSRGHGFALASAASAASSFAAVSAPASSVWPIEGQNLTE